MGNKIVSVFDEIKVTVENRDAPWSERQHQPCLYGNSPQKTDIDKAFRWCCNETAKKNDTSLTLTDDIRKLENKRDQAIDILHGVDEFSDTLTLVNKALRGTSVPKLGN